MSPWEQDSLAEQDSLVGMASPWEQDKVTEETQEPITGIADIAGKAYKSVFDEETVGGAFEQHRKAFGKGIVYGVAGLPELANMAVSALTGGKSSEYFPETKAGAATNYVESLFNSIGLETDPEPSVGTSIAREAASAMTGAGILGAAGKAQTGVKFLTEVSQNLPKILLTELGLSIPAGVTAYGGGELAEEYGVPRETGEAIGALMGGVVAPVTLAKTAVTAKNVGHKTSELFGLSTNARGRVAQRGLIESASKPESITRLKEGIKRTRYGEAGTGELLDDPGLIAMKRTLQRSGDVPSGRSQEVSEIQRNSLLEGLDELRPKSDTGAVSMTKQFFSNRLNKAVDKIKGRTDIAHKKASDAISKLSVDSPIDVVQAEARTHLNGALKAARAEENKVWGEIGNGKYNVDAINKRVTDFIKGEGAEDPELVHSMMRWMSKQFKGEKDISVILKRRTALNEVIRDLNSQQKFRLARPLKAIRNNMLDDLTSLSEDVDMKVIDDAREFSRKLNDTFTSGPLGKILGYSSTGGNKVAPETALEAMKLNSTGGVAALRKIRAGIGEMLGDGAVKVDDLDNMVEDFLKIKYASATNKKSFLKSHDMVLGDYPDLKARMLDADSSQEILDSVSKTAKARIERVENISHASQYIGSEVSDGVLGILKDKNPTKAMRMMKNMALKDKTGKSIKGVKASFYEAIYDRVTKTTANGEIGIDNRKLRGFLKSYKGAVKEIYGKQGAKVLEEVLKGAEINARLSKGMAAGGGSETFQRTAGAVKTWVGNTAVMLGSRLHGKLGIKTNQLLFAGMMRRGAENAASQLFDNEIATAHIMLEKALVDPEFATALLRIPASTPVSKLPLSLKQALAITTAEKITELTNEE